MVKNVIIGPSTSVDGAPGKNEIFDAAPIASNPSSPIKLNLILAKPLENEISFGTRNFEDIVLFEYVKPPLNNFEPFSK